MAGNYDCRHFEKSNEMVDTPNRIRELRLAMSMSGEQLAKALGTTNATISRLEQGKQALTTGWMERIAKKLRVLPSDLLNQHEIYTYAYIKADLSEQNSSPGFWPKHKIYPFPVPRFAIPDLVTVNGQ